MARRARPLRRVNVATRHSAPRTGVADWLRAKHWELRLFIASTQQLLSPPQRGDFALTLNRTLEEGQEQKGLRGERAGGHVCLLPLILSAPFPRTMVPSPPFDLIEPYVALKTKITPASIL
ncbi:hypothetical protein J6590_053130 [Homalodisca vitripennis]|nr:hypothetical protein J6590_053130 [Homalodisca vitripennis]